MRIGCVRSVRKGFILLALAGAAAVLLVPAGQRLAYPLRYRALIISSAREAELDPALVAAVIYCESRFDPSAVSPAGAVGLMQVMPATALWLSEQEGWKPPEGEALADPAVNIALGCAMLRRMINLYRDADTALAAFNAGPGRVDEWLADARYSADGRTLTDIPYPQTSAYVRKVRAAYEKYQALYSWP